MRDEPVRRFLGLYLFRSFAECQCFALRKNVRHKYVVMPPQRVKRVVEGNEVTGNQACSLMNQLVEGVLPVGSGLAPVDWAGLMPHRSSFDRNALTVALHCQLLQVSREALQVLVVWQDGNRLCIEEVV